MQSLFRRVSLNYVHCVLEQGGAVILPGLLVKQNCTMTHIWDSDGPKLYRAPLIASLGSIVQIKCDEQHIVQQNNFLPGLLCVWGTGHWQQLELRADGQQLCYFFAWSGVNLLDDGEGSWQ